MFKYNDLQKVGSKVKGLEIKSFADAKKWIKKSKIKIAIVAVPAKAAQEVVNELSDLGLKAILNFAPVSLKAPDDVLIKNTNMSIELEALSYFLTKSKRK